jgi:hypothetical protein
MLSNISMVDDVCHGQELDCTHIFGYCQQSTQSTLYSIYCILYSIYYILYIIFYILYSIYYIIYYILYIIFYILYFIYIIVIIIVIIIIYICYIYMLYIYTLMKKIIITCIDYSTKVWMATGNEVFDEVARNHPGNNEIWLLIQTKHQS